MTIKRFIGVSIALALLTAGCGGGTSPNGASTSTSQPSVAASATPALASPTASIPPTQVTVAASPTLAVASPTVSTPPTLTSAAPSSNSPTNGTPTPATASVSTATSTASGDAAAADVPKPNPLPALAPGGNKDYAASPGADITTNGAAAKIHGSVAAGQVVFAQNCQGCHGIEGKIGIPNLNSTDGTVPPLNPLDPAFNTIAKGDAAVYVRGIDLFIQHGSRPAGANPTLSMAGWGDQKKLTQQQIADVEAYLMKLNGVTWPGN